jgi:crotonobetainyl-CoA:carnitine CoA-transferase CaiB-like acyl-CoA transferase
MLQSYRVLDLACGRGALSGLMLAQLGAEVISVEPKGGHATRGWPMWHEAYGRGRTALTGDADQIIELARTADVVIDTGVFGLDLALLRDDNPALVTVSITPFGDTGPKAAWVGTDMTVVAASGHMMLNGDSDRAPVRISEPQSFQHASSEAVVHTLAALMERQRSGAGQHIDVSAQHAMMQASQMHMLAAALGSAPPNRFSGGMKIGPYELRMVYPAVDGHVAITFLFGDMIGAFTQRLMDWVHEERHCSDQIQALDYRRFFDLIYQGKLQASDLVEATDAVARLTATKTKAELLQASFDRSLLIAPVATTADTLAFEQFDARDFWEVESSADGTELRYPGPWAKATTTPLHRLGAPKLVGADNNRWNELLTRRTPSFERSAGRDPDTSGRPLEGLRVLDLTWVLAGPLITKVLADLGATVVRIESDLRPDVIRSAGPFMPDKEGPDATGLWHSAAAGKMSLQLDISSDGGKAVVKDLARWADLVVESFSPGAIDRLGFGYEALSADNPALVMLSTSLLGQTGPLAKMAGFGNLAAALTGFFEVTGWPDRAPAGPFTAYTDYVSPRFAAAAALAAVDNARRTGAGQYIDVSQAEAASHFLGPALLRRQVDGVTAPRRGNADPLYSPHGAYPAEGEDRWMAIACLDDAQWRELADVVGASAELVSLGLAERQARSDEIDALVAVWCADRAPEEMTEQLQALGIAAHGVQHSAQIVTDPQLAHREYAQQVPHPDHGQVWVEGSQARWSRTQPRPLHSGPPVGQHTQDVLSGILGYTEDQIADLVIAGAIT